MPWLLILKRAWPYLAGAGVVAVVWWQVDGWGDRRYEAGQAETQGRWDIENQAEAKALSDRLAADKAADEQAALDRKTIAGAHSEALLAIARQRDSLASRLQHAIAQSRDRPRAPAGDPEGAGPASPPAGSEPVGVLAAAVADTVTEGKGNADQLDRLLELLRRDPRVRFE
jgi:hypothetical protein